MHPSKHVTNFKMFGISFPILPTQKKESTFSGFLSSWETCFVSLKSNLWKKNFIILLVFPRSEIRNEKRRKGCGKFQSQFFASVLLRQSKMFGFNQLDGVVGFPGSVHKEWMSIFPIISSFKIDNWVFPSSFYFLKKFSYWQELPNKMPESSIKRSNVTSFKIKIISTKFISVHCLLWIFPFDISHQMRNLVFSSDFSFFLLFYFIFWIFACFLLDWVFHFLFPWLFCRTNRIII